MVTGDDDLEPLKTNIPLFVKEIICGFNPKNKTALVIDCGNRRETKRWIIW